jgi:hypothetical protein
MLVQGLVLMQNASGLQKQNVSGHALVDLHHIYGSVGADVRRSSGRAVRGVGIQWIAWSNPV